MTLKELKKDKKQAKSNIIGTQPPLNGQQLVVGDGAGGVDIVGSENIHTERWGGGSPIISTVSEC